MITPPSFELICAVRFEVDSPVMVDVPQGQRMIVNVRGGTVSGPGLEGSIVSGADWALRRTDGDVAVNARVVVLPHDDDRPIALTYTGLGVRADDSLRILVTPSFEAHESSRYAWLNHVVAVAAGRASPGHVEYDIFRVL